MQVSLPSGSKGEKHPFEVPSTTDEEANDRGSAIDGEEGLACVSVDRREGTERSSPSRASLSRESKDKLLQAVNMVRSGVVVTSAFKTLRDYSTLELSRKDLKIVRRIGEGEERASKGFYLGTRSTYSSNTKLGPPPHGHLLSFAMCESFSQSLSLEVELPP